MIAESINTLEFLGNITIKSDFSCAGREKGKQGLNANRVACRKSIRNNCWQRLNSREEWPVEMLLAWDHFVGNKWFHT